MSYEYLKSNCEYCTNENCEEAVKINPTNGRAYITMGHAGFNSTTNNRGGYETVGRAKEAIRYFKTGKRKKG